MKARLGERAEFWAGGTDLMVPWRRGDVPVECCIDLTFVTELKFIAQQELEMRIGAMATLDDLDRATGRNEAMAAVGTAARVMCTPQTRTIATVGGNLCHAVPSADLPPVFIALDAEADILSTSGRRTVSMEKFFQGPKRTVLARDELLTQIRIPISASARGASYHRVSRTVVDIALAGAAASITADDGGTIVQARVALGAVAPVPIRSRSSEEVLIGRRLSEVDNDALIECGRLASLVASPISDLRASAEYRKVMSSVLTRRALKSAIGNIGGCAR